MIRFAMKIGINLVFIALFTIICPLSYSTFASSFRKSYSASKQGGFAKILHIVTEPAKLTGHAATPRFGRIGHYLLLDHL